MHLFDPLALGEVSLRNRIVVSPMCQYSSRDGFADDWHLVHLGGLATGGAGLVFTEASAVEPRGRISPEDLGLWDNRHVEMLARITRFVTAHGAVPGIQLAHAGRKASTAVPWRGGAPVSEAEGGWRPVGASALPFAEGHAIPEELDEPGIAALIAAFAAAARRALAAGFQVVEVHGAHGYLLHSFLSPLSNQRTDRWGGSFEGRTRLIREVVRAVRREWPARLPLFVRLSCTDWSEGGWDLEQSVALARALGPEGVDVFDCSSGGNLPKVKIPVGPGFQTSFAARLRAEAGVRTCAVGAITAPEQADHIIRTGQADLVALARERLRDPRWPLRASRVLGHDGPWPRQYQRAK